MKLRYTIVASALPKAAEQRDRHVARAREIIAEDQVVCCDLDREPYIDRLEVDAGEPARHHADNRVLALRDAEPLPDGGAASAEPALPQAVADDRDRCRNGGGFAGTPQSARCRRHAEQVEVGCAYERGAKFVRVLAMSFAHDGRLVRRDALETLRFIAERGVQRIRHEIGSHLPCAGSVELEVDPDDSTGVADSRRRAKEERVCDAKHRGIRAQAERDAGDGQECVALRAGQGTKRGGDVTKQCVHEGVPPG